MLGNGLHMFDNGPHSLGNSTFGIMSHLGLLYSMCHLEFCRILNFVTFGIMSHLGLCWLELCCSGLCRIWGYVVQHNVAFGIMSHSDLCRLA